MSANIPEVKLGIIAVSRDCFPIALSTSRRQAIVKAYGEGIYECPITVENELDAQKAISDNRIRNIRYVSFVPVVVLSDIPETDVGPTIEAGADACYDNNLPPPVIALLLSAQLRRYTEYNHFREPETAPFQVGDIAIDPCRRFVWVCGRRICLFPREFSLLLYFMQNPNIVLNQEQICKYAWKRTIHKV